jgi:hypothetical protein
MSGSEITFDHSTVAHRDLAKRLKMTADALPPGWVAGRLPRPSFPIDECVDQLIRKKRRIIRASAELQAIHPLGACPYGVARSAVVHAASYAGTQLSYEKELKPAVAAAAKYFKAEGRWLGKVIYGAELQAQVLVDGLDLLELSLPRRKAIFKTLSHARRLLEGASDDFTSLHKQLSKNPGDVWRLSFVRKLFNEWWVLTGKDPKASPGPFQEFVCAAWCTLSPLAAPTDADWRSAIKTALNRCQPGQWRGRLRPESAPPVDGDRRLHVGAVNLEV